MPGGASASRWGGWRAERGRAGEGMGGAAVDLLGDEGPGLVLGRGEDQGVERQEAQVQRRLWHTPPAPTPHRNTNSLSAE